MRNGESQWILPTSGAGPDAGPVYPHRDRTGYAAVIEVRFIGKSSRAISHATQHPQEKLVISVFQLTIVIVRLRLLHSAKRLCRNIIRTGSALGGETKASLTREKELPSKHLVEAKRKRYSQLNSGLESRIGTPFRVDWTSSARPHQTFLSAFSCAPRRTTANGSACPRLVTPPIAISL